MRTWLLLGSAALILFEVVSVVLLVPLGFAISLEQVYAEVNLGSILWVCVIAGVLAFLVPALAAAYVDRRPGRWTIINTWLLSVGAITTIFFWVDVVVSVGYSALDDRYPEGYSDSPFWVAEMNVVGLPLFAAWLVSAFTHLAVHRAWKVPPP
jgi:hypothetical protein